MTKMHQPITDFLKDSELEYDFNSEACSYDLALGLNNGTVHLRILPRESEDYVLVIAFWDGRIPTRSIPAVLPIINEINGNTRFTTLAVEPEKGDISCHCAINTDESALSAKQVQLCMQLVASTLDSNMERIMRAAWNAPANFDGKYN